jgi:2-phosphosulfolactate phosphatase
MKFHYLSLENCDQATGCVVVIDVCRAFTTAAFAFDRGVEKIVLMSTVEEALALRKSNPNYRVMGEVNGLPVPGFDFWNSPAQIQDENLEGIILVQRTTAGTQGMVRSIHAGVRLAAGFTNARATVACIRRLGFEEISFVQTGIHAWPDGSRSAGEEDIACAKYMSALLSDEEPFPTDFLGWVNGSFGDLEARDPTLSVEFQKDIACCAQVDRFHFAMQAREENDLLVMRKVLV